MHNADYHKVASPSSHEPDEVVLLPDSGPIPTGESGYIPQRMKDHVSRRELSAECVNSLDWVPYVDKRRRRARK